MKTVLVKRRGFLRDYTTSYPPKTVYYFFLHVSLWGPATSRNVAGSRPDEANFFPICLILAAALGPGFAHFQTELSTRSTKVMFLGSRARPVPVADDLTAICEPVVYRLWDP
jgi:hypothetical protein